MNWTMLTCPIGWSFRLKEAWMIRALYSLEGGSRMSLSLLMGFSLKHVVVEAAFVCASHRPNSEILRSVPAGLSLSCLSHLLFITLYEALADHAFQVEVLPQCRQSSRKAWVTKEGHESSRRLWWLMFNLSGGCGIDPVNASPIKRMEKWIVKKKRIYHHPYASHQWQSTLHRTVGYWLILTVSSLIVNDSSLHKSRKPSMAVYSSSYRRILIATDGVLAKAAIVNDSWLYGLKSVKSILWLLRSNKTIKDAHILDSNVDVSTRERYDEAVKLLHRAQWKAKFLDFEWTRRSYSPPIEATPGCAGIGKWHKRWIVWWLLSKRIIFHPHFCFLFGCSLLEGMVEYPG